MRSRGVTLTVACLALACGGPKAGADGDEGTSDTSGTSGTGTTGTTSTTDESSTSTTEDSTSTTDDMKFDVGGLPDVDTVMTACPLDLNETAMTQGNTPLGVFDGKYAWYAWWGGECPGAHRILITETLDEFEWYATHDEYFDVDMLSGGLHVTLEDADWNQWEGTGPAQFRVFSGAQLEELEGTVTITSIETYPWVEPDANPYPMFEGTFAVSGNGWDLTGSFTAPWCSNITILCP